MVCVFFWLPNLKWFGWVAQLFNHFDAGNNNKVTGMIGCGYSVLTIESGKCYSWLRKSSQSLHLHGLTKQYQYYHKKIPRSCNSLCRLDLIEFVAKIQFYFFTFFFEALNLLISLFYHSRPKLLDPASHFLPKSRCIILRFKKKKKKKYFD